VYDDQLHPISAVLHGKGFEFLRFPQTRSRRRIRINGGMNVGALVVLERTGWWACSPRETTPARFRVAGQVAPADARDRSAFRPVISVPATATVEECMRL